MDKITTCNVKGVSYKLGFQPNLVQIWNNPNPTPNPKPISRISAKENTN